MAETQRLVIVGGNAAGMSAAAKAKRRAPELEVEVLEAGPHVSYSVCGIPSMVEGQVGYPDQLLVLTPEKAKERGIAVRTGCRVVSFDTDNKEDGFQTVQ